MMLFRMYNVALGECRIWNVVSLCRECERRASGASESGWSAVIAEQYNIPSIRLMVIPCIAARACLFPPIAVAVCQIFICRHEWKQMGDGHSEIKEGFQSQAVLPNLADS